MGKRVNGYKQRCVSLALAKKVVEIYGGQICRQSRPERRDHYRPDAAARRRQHAEHNAPVSFPSSLARV